MLLPLSWLDALAREGGMKEEKASPLFPERGGQESVCPWLKRNSLLLSRSGTEWEFIFT